MTLALINAACRNTPSELHSSSSVPTKHLEAMAMILYKGENFTGESTKIGAEVAALTGGFNDTVKSIEVTEGNANKPHDRVSNRADCLVPVEL